jgi:putative addiction module component (TIGR02574 family)
MRGVSLHLAVEVVMSSEPADCDRPSDAPDAAFEAEWKREIARRIEECERDPTTANRGEQVLAELSRDLAFERRASSSPIPKSLVEAAMALPAEAREELANLLLDSLAPPIEPEILKAMAEETERRITAYDRGEMKAISQEEFLAWRRARWDGGANIR